LPEPRFQAALVRLLFDRDPRVLRDAIDAARRRVERDGFQPLYVPRLVSLLATRQVKHDARQALVAFGDPAIPTLAHFLADPAESLWVRRALPKTLAGLADESAVAALAAALQIRDDPFLRRKVIEALDGVDRALLGQGAPALVRDNLAYEASEYLRGVALLEGLGLPEGAEWIGPTLAWADTAHRPLLHTLLAEGLEDRLRNITGLLALVHVPRDVGAAHRALVSGRRADWTRALEYLDNLLSGEIHRHVFSVIGDAPLGERLEHARRAYGVEPRGREEALEELILTPPTSPSARDLTMAAIYQVYVDREPRLAEWIASLRHATTDPVLAETAAWVLSRADAKENSP
jgi:hypothetical protein